MRDQDRDAIVTICLLAARVDGGRSPEEQEQFEQVMEDLGVTDMPALFARLRTATVDAGEAARSISTAHARRTAYEMAVSICYADGDLSEQERRFLEELRTHLGLGTDPDLERMGRDARGLATAPLPGPPLTLESGGGSGPRPSQAGIPAVTPDAAIDAMIRQHALLAGALELLPQTLATLAVIPVQLRLVHRIGADVGQKPDQQQVTVLLGALGVGAVTQVLDGVARKTLGGLGRGLLGRLFGGVAGGAAGAVTGMGLAFASTYALGHIAKQYYAQGGKLSREDLEALARRFRTEARELLPKVQDEIRAQSQRLDLDRLMATLKGTVTVEKG
ncbi:MAG: TerB family tellurite resistance protein [Gemmatimonadales bacterium]